MGPWGIEQCGMKSEHRVLHVFKMLPYAEAFPKPLSTRMTNLQFVLNCNRSWNAFSKNRNMCVKKKMEQSLKLVQADKSRWAAFTRCTPERPHESPSAGCLRCNDFLPLLLPVSAAAGLHSLLSEPSVPPPPQHPANIPAQMHLWRGIPAPNTTVYSVAAVIDFKPVSCLTVLAASWPHVRDL